MADRFLSLSQDDRRDALEAAPGRGLERAPYLLEKDVWVVWTLEALFAAPFADGLVFKGGTSLSKAYDVIDRFSEDVDLTYDIGKLTGDTRFGEPTQLTPDEAKSVSRRVRERLLPRFIRDTVAPYLAQRLATDSLPARIEQDGQDLLVVYETATGYPAYVRPRVKLEFGARATGQPATTRPVDCYLAKTFAELEFPTAAPSVMTAERTFWEKATAVHVFCVQGRFKGGAGFARHGYDLARLDLAGVADRAIADSALAMAVADHKAKFFVESDPTGQVIDYAAAVTGGLRLVPEGEARAVLEADYQAMVEAGYLDGAVESFDALMARCQSLQDKANVAASAPVPSDGVEGVLDPPT